MAQALCGPSNALQNLQKHTSTDRSLQQDRLVSSQSSSSTQNFRSRIPDEDLAADAELAAFESGIAVPAPPPPALAGPAAFAAHHHAFQQQHPHHPAPFAPPSAIAAHQAESSWAADFQQLSISGAPTQHARSQALPFRPAVGGWHEEFMQQQRLNPLHQQQQQSAPVPVPTQQQQHHVSQRLFGTVGAMNPMSQFNMYNSPATTTAFNQSTTTQQQPTETFDDAAFEAAFAEARAEIDQLEQQSTHHIHENVTTTTETETIDAAESLHHQEVRIGADTIQNTTDRSGVDQQDDLARTAGQLLDSVQHETSQKFKESNFLALMRQLRDREVVVDGDEFRQVKQPLHPGGEFYPEGRRSIAEAVVEEVVAQQQSQQQQQQQQSSDSELPPLPYGHGYETSYGNNYIESKSLGDSNVLYDGMAWEKGVLPDYLRVV